MPKICHYTYVHRDFEGLERGRLAQLRHTSEFIYDAVMFSNRCKTFEGAFLELRKSVLELRSDIDQELEGEHD